MEYFFAPENKNPKIRQLTGAFPISNNFRLFFADLQCSRTDFIYLPGMSYRSY